MIYSQVLGWGMNTFEAIILPVTPDRKTRLSIRSTYSWQDPGEYLPFTSLSGNSTIIPL